jgi:hypothetical protein
MCLLQLKAERRRGSQAEQPNAANACTGEPFSKDRVSCVRTLCGRDLNLIEQLLGLGKNRLFDCATECRLNLSNRNTPDLPVGSQGAHRPAAQQQQESTAGLALNSNDGWTHFRQLPTQIGVRRLNRLGFDFYQIRSIFDPIVERRRVVWRGY